MPHHMTLTDRLRVERAVWELDQRLYELPRQSRISKRREVRENLRAAAADVGVREALKNLGNTRELAAEYRAAEFDNRPRPSWTTAAVFLLAGQLVFTEFLTEAANAFAAGITAANAHATGTFTWSGIRYLQDSSTYTFTDGHGTWSGGAWTPIAWAVWLAATIAVGRLWRALPLRRERRSANEGA